MSMWHSCIRKKPHGTCGAICGIDKSVAAIDAKRYKEHHLIYDPKHILLINLRLVNLAATPATLSGLKCHFKLIVTHRPTQNAASTKMGKQMVMSSQNAEETHQRQNH